MRIILENDGPWAISLQAIATRTHKFRPISRTFQEPYELVPWSAARYVWQHMPEWIKSQGAQ